MSHTYASVAEFAAALQDGSPNTPAEVVLKKLEAASRRVEWYCSRSRFGSGFGPRYGTNRYSGGEAAYPDQAVVGSGGYRDRLYFDDDLIDLTTLGVVLSPGASATTYTEDTHFFLVPYDRVPARALVLADSSPMVFPALRRNISAAGIWGYEDRRETAVATMNVVADATTRTLTPSAITEFSPGQTLWLETEMVYVHVVGTTTLTVDRGANGSTAAAHAALTPIKVARYHSSVVDATLQVATRRWRRRDTNQAQAFGESGFVQLAPEPGEMSILRNTVDDLRCENFRFELAQVAVAG